MRRVAKQDHASRWGFEPGAWSDTIENFKRRRALQPLSGLDLRERLFFARVLNIKKMRELVFITKSAAKHR